MKVLCGRNAAGVRKAAEQLGWEETATDWRAVIARDDIDLVDVSTPGDSHAEIAIAAARAGKAVFCEKPLANTLAEAQGDAGRGQEGRRHPHGLPQLPAHPRGAARAPAHRRRPPRARSATTARPTCRTGSSTRSSRCVWRLQKNLAGSGALGDLASHSVDLARFLVGEITEVAGALETFIKRRPLPGNPKKSGTVTVDDAAIALVRFGNGALGSIEASRMAPGRRNSNRFEINGSEGSLAFDLERMNELEVFYRADARAEQGFRRILVTEPEHPYVKAWWPPGHIIGYEHTFTHTVYDLLQAMDRKKLPTPNFEDGVRNQAVLARHREGGRAAAAG